MRELRSLEPLAADSHAQAAEDGWGARHGLIMLGLVAVVVAGTMAVYFYRQRPVAPVAFFTEEKLQASTEQLTLLQTYQVWEQMRQGLHGKRRIDKAYHDAMKAYCIRLGVTGVVLLAAVGLVVVVLLVPRTRQAEADREPYDRSAPQDDSTPQD